MPDPKEFLSGLYRTMLRIRLSEEALVEPIARKEVRCPCHLCSGQEAVAAGICAALTERDYVFGTHRSHGHYLAKGGSLEALIAEVFGKRTGCSRGRGGSMHLLGPEVGMLGAAPIVAGTISLALGAAQAASIRGDRRVAVCFFGDGATGEGVLYESMNYAALRRLPILFVCENNLYSTHLPISECRVRKDIFGVAEPFGVRGVQVDGNDVLAVYEAGRDAAARGRAGEGPTFIECMTYRLRGHVGPDDNIQGSRTDIRPKEEVEAWRRRDPIAAFRDRLLRRGVLDEGRLTEIEGAAAAEVEAALESARRSPLPDKESLHDHVYR